MNRLFLSVQNKMCSGVFRLHKGVLGLVVLAALLILGAFMLLADRAQPQTLSGIWYSQEGDFTLTAWYDKPEAQGGRIRVIVAREN